MLFKLRGLKLIRCNLSYIHVSNGVQLHGSLVFDFELRVLQIHYPSVTLSAQKNGYLSAQVKTSFGYMWEIIIQTFNKFSDFDLFTSAVFQTEGGGDIHINSKGNNTAVYFDNINLLQLIEVRIWISLTNYDFKIIYDIIHSYSWCIINKVNYNL